MPRSRSCDGAAPRKSCACCAASVLNIRAIAYGIDRMSTTTAGDDTTRRYLPALIVLTSLFFMWGLITSLNDILIPHLKGIFTLSYVQVMLIQFCFFGAYLVMSYPSGYLVERLGYRRGIVIGLSTAGVGCLLFYPAAGL